MFESAKKIYSLWRTQKSQNGGVCVAKFVKNIRAIITFLSDRRDIDDDKTGVYLKKRFRAICDGYGIYEGDIIRDNTTSYRVVSAYSCGGESILHLETTSVFNNTAFNYDTEAIGNV